MSLVHVKGRLVVCVDNESTDESSKELGEDVGGELFPGEASEDGIGKGDGRVKMGSRDTTRSVDTKHDTDTPAPGDGLVSTIFVTGEDYLGDDTVTEQNDEHGTQELSERFADLMSDAWPERKASVAGRVHKGVIVAHGRESVCMGVYVSVWRRGLQDMKRKKRTLEKEYLDCGGKRDFK